MPDPKINLVKSDMISDIAQNMPGDLLDKLCNFRFGSDELRRVDMLHITQKFNEDVAPVILKAHNEQGRKDTEYNVWYHYHKLFDERGEHTAFTIYMFLGEEKNIAMDLSNKTVKLTPPVEE